MDQRTLRLFELNRMLVDRLKTASKFFVKGTSIFELIDTTLISFALPNAFIYKDNRSLKRFIPESLKMVLKRTISPRDKYVSGDCHKCKVAVFIPNNKQMDIYLALASESKNSNVELVPIIWSEEVITSSSLRCVYFNNYLSISHYLKTYLSIRREISSQVYSVPPDIIEDYCSLFDMKYEDVETKLGAILENTLARSLKTLSRISSTAERIQKEFAFDSAVFTNEREETAKFAIFGLRQAGISRTFGLQRGVILDHPEVGEVYTDKMIVDGDFFKRNLIMRGCNPEKIEVLGSPRLDVLLRNNTPQNKLKVRSSQKIPNNKTVFLIITEVHALGVTENDQREYMEFVLSLLRHLDNGYFIIKAHPNQRDVGLEQKIASDILIKGTYSICHKESVFDLIVASDFVITEFSTVGTEALTVGKPLLIPERKKDTVDWLKFKQSGLAFGFSSVASLKEAIDRSRVAHLDREFLKDMFHSLDGYSSKRVLDFIATETRE